MQLPAESTQLISAPFSSLVLAALGLKHYNKFIEWNGSFFKKKKKDDRDQFRKKYKNKY